MADVAIADGGELCAFYDKRFVEGGAARSIDCGDFLMARQKKKAARGEGKRDQCAEQETCYPHWRYCCERSSVGLSAE
jgi:hypothetical protein